jgi:geranylgeranyl pyrophosphate synthase
LLDHVEDGDVLDEPWAGLGPGPTLNITSGILFSAMSRLDTLEGAGVHATTVRDIKQDFYQTLLRMCAGQHADLTLAEPTLEQCWQVADAKSGAFFGLACRAGARLATSDVGCIDLFSQFGHHFGLLIQIGDDLSGLWASDTTPSDLRSGQPWTLPIAYALTTVADDDRLRLRTCLGLAAVDGAAEEEAQRIAIKAGAVLYLAIEAQRHYQRAQAALRRAVPPSAAREALIELLDASLPLGLGASKSATSSGTVEQTRDRC